MKVLIKTLCVGAFCCSILTSFSDVSVTASRAYVNTRTTLHPVTNTGTIVGYNLGIQTNIILLSSDIVTNNDSTVNQIRAMKPTRLGQYLWEIGTEGEDFTKATNRMASVYPSYGSCTGVTTPRYHGRNLDWEYNQQATIVVRSPSQDNKLGCIGIVGGILNDSFLESQAWTNAYYSIPFSFSDGINECGVVIQQNVIPKTLSESHIWHTKRNAQVICFCIVRYALDRGTNAYHAAQLINNNIFVPTEFPFDFHYQVSDRENTYIVEDGVIYTSSTTRTDIMTNFRIGGVTFTASGLPDWSTVEEYGIGLERYENVRTNTFDKSTLYGMISTMTNVWYTQAYKTSTTPYWYTEHCDSATPELTVMNAKTNHNTQAWTQDVATWYSDYTSEHNKSSIYYRAGTTWQTTHTAIYDKNEIALYLYTQEDMDSARFFRLTPDVPTLKDDFVSLTNSINFRSAVSSIPIDLSKSNTVTKIANAEISESDAAIAANGSLAVSSFADYEVHVINTNTLLEINTMNPSLITNYMRFFISGTKEGWITNKTTNGRLTSKTAYKPFYVVPGDDIWLDNSGCWAYYSEKGRALGEGSVSFGGGTAWGIRSAAFGAAGALGHRSFARGGLKTQAWGNYSASDGDGSVSWGTMSHAEGFRTVTLGLDSHAEGYLTLASNTSSHAEGYKTETHGLYSHAEGYETMAFGEGSHAEGYRTISSGKYSHSGGDLSVAEGNYSHAYGYNAKALGNFSFAIGVNSTVSSENGILIGKGSSIIATATNGIAISTGQNTIRTPNGISIGNDIIIGSTNNTDGDKAVAIGKSLRSLADSAIAMGIFACIIPSYKYAFVWNGDPSCGNSDGTYNDSLAYNATKQGGFFVNPVGGTDGFYIGKTNLTDIIGDKIQSATNGIPNAIINSYTHAVRNLTNGWSVLWSGANVSWSVWTGGIPENGKTVMAFGDETSVWDKELSSLCTIRNYSGRFLFSGAGSSREVTPVYSNRVVYSFGLTTSNDVEYILGPITNDLWTSMQYMYEYLTETAIKTNDVCNIVTNDVDATWYVSGGNTNGIKSILQPEYWDVLEEWRVFFTKSDGTIGGSSDSNSGKDATTLQFDSFSMSRDYIGKRNALGLVYLRDIPAITNSVVESIKSDLPGLTNSIVPQVEALSSNTNITFTIDGDDLIIKTNNVAVWNSGNSSTKSTEKRYALFIIHLNPGGTTHPFSDIELKATTNNYENNSFLFYCASSGNEDATLWDHDWCRMYILSSHVDSDVRKWRRIKNTYVLGTYNPRDIAILIDPSMFRNGQGSAWCAESNDELIWSYVRINGAEPELDEGSTKQLWRPIMPVRWYSELPAWSKQESYTTY